MTPTGEQPKAETAVSPLGEKSIFDWKFVVLAIGLAFEAGQAHIRLGALEKADVAKDTTIASLTAQVVKLDKDTATKSDVQKTTDAINNLTLKFTEFAATFGAAGGTVRAVHRQPREPGP